MCSESNEKRKGNTPAETHQDEKSDKILYTYIYIYIYTHIFILYTHTHISLEQKIYFKVVFFFPLCWLKKKAAYTIPTTYIFIPVLKLKALFLLRYCITSIYGKVWLYSQALVS